LGPASARAGPDYRPTFHSPKIFEKFWQYAKDVLASFVGFEKVLGELRECLVVDSRLLRHCILVQKLVSV